jgi:2'-hydroxyisoflavone reductase
MSGGTMDEEVRPAPAAARLRLLLLGGTGFLGRHLAERALARGHRVTLFNRGRTGPGLFPQAEHVRGDRLRDADALSPGRWDAAVDTSGHVPTAVRRAGQVLAERVDHYTYVSTVSAYADLSASGLDETAPLAPWTAGAPEELSEATYGALKAAGEREARAAYGDDRTLIVRPGLLVGPYDGSGRFGYWVRRIARGGRVLAPGRPERPVQFLDARDLAAWILAQVEARATGAFNAVGPARPLEMEWLLETCRVEAGSRARLEWVDEEFLLREGVHPWTEMPLWVPENVGLQRGFFTVSNARAVAAGLTFRRILDTVRDVRLWETGRPEAPQTLDGRREEALLAAWARRDAPVHAAR